jgi:hypothetical protein
VLELTRIVSRNHFPACAERTRAFLGHFAGSISRSKIAGVAGSRSTGWQTGPRRKRNLTCAGILTLRRYGTHTGSCATRGLLGVAAAFVGASRAACDAGLSSARERPQDSARGSPDGQVAPGTGCLPNARVDRPSSAARAADSTLHHLFQIYDPTAARH